MSATAILWLAVAALWLHSGAVQWEAMALHARLVGVPTDAANAVGDPSHPGHWAALVTFMLFVLTWPAWMLVGKLNAYIESRRATRSRP